MAPPLLQLKDIALTFGGTPLLSGADLAVSPGERVSLVGRNGSGKSTLLKIAAGLVEPDRGTVFVQPGALVRYLPQEPDFAGFASTLAYVEAGLRPGDDRYPARYLLEQLGLTGHENPAHLSGGEARRAALARVLAPSPDILLLDEPTNHLDLTTIEWLERELDARRSAIVIISHDRRFLSKLSRSTVWLDRGQTRQIERGFAHFEEWRDEVLAEEEREQHKLDRKIVAEEHWLRYGVTGRRKRNMRRVGQLQALRERRRSYRGAAGNANITAGSAAPKIRHARHRGQGHRQELPWPCRSSMISRSALQRGDRIGIVGPNGAGKTTLIDMLTGAKPPDTGSVRLGSTIAVATLDQHRESLDPDVTAGEALTGGSRRHRHGRRQAEACRQLHEGLSVRQEQTRTPLGKLSGGERGRLMLARALAKPSNLLVLDEPTNDLDIETLDVLEEMLADYDGTVLLISHDRDFLDRVVSGVIVPEGDGRWVEYAGGYTDMLAQRGADLTRQTPRDAQKAAKEPASVAAAPLGRRRLMFKDKHALETLPKTIAALQAEMNALQAKLGDPHFYARDRAAFEQATASLGELQHKIAAAEEQWLALEILREELAGG